MSENYNVAVKLSLVENVSRGLLSMAGRFAAVNRQADLMQAKLSALKSQVAMGAGMIGAGAVIAAPFLVAINQAGKLQQQLKGVQLATHATDAQMEMFRKTVDQVALGTTFTNVQIANMGKKLATANSFSPDQIQRLMPSFANFAMAQSIIKGTGIEKSTDQAIKLAEVTGHFTPETIQPTLDAFNKLSLVMPGTIDQVLAAFVYADTTMKNVMGVSDNTTLLMVAFLQRMGIQGGRAGRGLLALVTRTLPQVFGSGLFPNQNAQMKLREMGLLNAQGQSDVFTAGKFDPMKFFEHLSLYTKQLFQQFSPEVARSRYMAAIQNTFGTMGGRIATAFANENAMKALLDMAKSFANMPNLDQTVEALNDLFNKQLPQAQAGITSLFATLGYALLPAATDALKGFNTILARAILFIHDNQTTVAIFSKAILGIAGLSILGGTLLIVRAGLMGLLIPLQLFGGAIGLLSATSGLALAPILGIGAALGLAAVGAYKAAETISGMSWSDFTNGVKTSLALVNFMFDGLFTSIENEIKGLLGIKVANDPRTDIVDNQDAYYRRIALQYPNSPDARAYRGSHKMPLVDSTLPSRGNKGSTLNGSGTVKQPIHVSVNLDGRKVGHAVAEHISHEGFNVPSAGSAFDPTLSPMPTMNNNIGMR